MLGQTYIHLLLQLSLFTFMENENNSLPHCLNAFGSGKLKSQESPYLYEYSIYVYADIILRNSSNDRIH